MIEAMADAGVLTGLPRKLSYKLASQAVLGAAKMVLDTQRQPGELKDEVCSPGGTTIEAIASLESNNFRGTIIEAMKACFEKTKAMEA
jgi:pyrroline-5-carboxylate reductase